MSFYCAPGQLIYPRSSALTVLVGRQEGHSACNMKNLPAAVQTIVLARRVGNQPN